MNFQSISLKHLKCCKLPCCWITECSLEEATKTIFSNLVTLKKLKQIFQVVSSVFCSQERRQSDGKATFQQQGAWRKSSWVSLGHIRATT